LELAKAQRKFIALKPSKTAKVKKLFRLELAKAHTKQIHKGKSIAHQIDKAAKV